MGLLRKMKRAAVKPPMSGLSVDVGRRLQLKSRLVNRKELDLHDKMLIKSTLDRSVDFWMTCTLMALHDEFGFGVVRLQRAYDKICGISACVGGGTIRLEDLQHFIGCGFDEDKYEKLFGKERVATPELDDQLKCALAVALPSGLREKLVSAANDDGLTLNQYVVKALKDSIKEG
ncbi:hypothetical protein [Megasphaera sp.]|uniref:hypothetical protein n=1 Tax=Megasphaera sp. TaxID=2023260 RepID=UPI004029109C